MSRTTTLAGDPFRRRTALALALVGGTALALALAYQVFGPAGDGTGGSPALRRSAIGYGALVRFLEHEVSVRPGPGVWPVAAAPDHPILVLDPAPRQLDALAETVRRAAEAEVPVVVVLPKWAGPPHPLRSGWVSEVAAVDLSVPAAVLVTLLRGAEDGGGAEAREVVVVRPEEAGELAGELTAPAPDSAGGGVGGGGRGGGPLRPLLTDPPQLIHDPAGSLEPLVASAEGVLIGKLRGRPLWLISDPDLLNVAGLGRGDNARLAHRLLVRRLAPAAWLVKTGRNGALPPRESVWSAMLRPPLSRFSLHLAVLALLVAWVAAERFGRPRRAAPRVEPGKATLVDNTARLLERAADPAASLQRYLDLTARRAAERLGLPAGLEGRRRLHRLDGIARRRGAAESLRDLAIAADNLPPERNARRRRALEVAAALHRWLHEVCEGGSGWN